MRTTLIAALAATATVVTALPALADFGVDNQFSGDGKLVVSSTLNDWFSDVAMVGTDVVAVGRYQDNRVIVAKYDATGQKVTAFGNDGRRLVDMGGATNPVELTVLGDGTLLVATLTEKGFALVRLTAEGDLDPTFGGDGIVRQTTGSYSRLSSVVDGAGRIVVAVGEHTGDDPWRTRIHVWRFASNGDTDATFADGDVTASPDQAHLVTGVAVDASDRIYTVSAQYSDSRPRSGMTVTRFASDGSSHSVVRRLSAWDKDGTVPIGIDATSAGAFAIGITGATSSRVGAVVMSTDGALVDAFSGDGLLLGTCAQACGITGQSLDAADNLLLFGGVDDNDRDYFYDRSWFARITDAGRWDRTFGNSGQRMLDLFRGLDVAYGATTDGNGRILVGGRLGRTADAYLARLKSK